MNVRLRLAGLGLPFPIRDALFRDFFALTARSFEAPLPDLRGLSHRRRLALYRDFTLERAAAVATDGASRDAAAARLGGNGRDFGRRIRKMLGVRTGESAMAAARILYRAVGIDFLGRPAGTVTIRRCFFSGRYSPEVCRLVSALDEGVLAGLHDGGRLEFQARLTEGAPECRAEFVREETAP